MSYEFYLTLHLSTIISLFLLMGALLLTPIAKSSKQRKWLMAGHGLVSLLLVLSGFGLMARLHLFSSFPTWIWLKLGIWFVLSAVFPFLLLKRINRTYLWVIVWLGGLCAIWLVVYQFSW